MAFEGRAGRAAACDSGATPPAETDLARVRLTGASPAFLAALRVLRKLSACDATVLIRGETGTGKELAARAIHYLGTRRNAPFIPVNCGAIPDTLIESEFFGYARGAFTDAKESRAGLIEQAENGTLFLDELEVLSPRAQVTLLRFLQDCTYRPVGGGLGRVANVRIIGSTNADLRAMADVGLFRADLLFRLSVLVLDLPPLRQRPGDATLLAETFLARLCERYRLPVKPFDAAARHYLESYEWPGNVRELENLVHRALLLSESAEISFTGNEGGAPDATATSTAPSMPSTRRSRSRSLSLSRARDRSRSNRSITRAPAPSSSSSGPTSPRCCAARAAT